MTIFLFAYRLHRRLMERKTSSIYDPDASRLLDCLTFIIETLQGKHRKGQ
jgi:hypothetical protein